MIAGEMKRLAIRAILVPATLLLLGGAAMAQDFGDMSCDDLWYARNAIYAEEGYCFKTEAALQEFGHRCYPPYGKLSRSEQAQVNAIQSWEARNGCD